MVVKLTGRLMLMCTGLSLVAGFGEGVERCSPLFQLFSCYCSNVVVHVFSFHLTSVVEACRCNLTEING